MSKNVIFSGVQPTGEIHLGNYLGAIKQFVDYQKDYNSIFSIVDLHAVTVWQDPQQLLNNIHKVLSIFLACGLDKEKNIIFNQSQVPEHTQLAWLLSCTARIGWLNRMTQFKDKAGKNRENASVGLYTYPILMAADIMLYKASHVPVGDDQKQHLELARDIAHKFNTDYNIDFFVLPEPLFNSDSTRIMSLRDGTKKMSKSDTSDYSRILMTDDNDTIALKIKKAKTDSLSMPESGNDLSKRPEIENLINIYSSCSGISKNTVIEQFSSKEISYFKKELSQVIINLIQPICSEAKKLYEDKNFLNQVLSSGAIRARQISQNTISDVYKIAGMI
ncbi:MAG: tryptophan--tRNA ligase [Pseudomonadota bacterium]|jgi:tryptophanyl-tRNA synthetase|nr:tryptophan--tRNA ligase [Pseudomonadota bacterium]|tara:strand:+ start:339 stop:1337 length:999 start_codon:yes stop_codon:yes gene_type:complete